MAEENPSDRQSESDRAKIDSFGRRGMLKKTGALTVGSTLGLGGTNVAVEPVAADSVTDSYDHDQDTAARDGFEDEAGAELGVAGPQHTHVQSNELAITWGISTVEPNNSSSLYAENVELTFSGDSSSNPADHSVNNVQQYSQGNQESNTTEIQYALDTMWQLSNIPVPNPLDVDTDDGPDVTYGNDLDSFTVNFGGKVWDDATGGVDFLLELGTDGSLETGEYNFDCKLTADVVIDNPYYTNTFGTLTCSCNVPIEVRE